jgi:hypothetical protein
MMEKRAEWEEGHMGCSVELHIQLPHRAIQTGHPYNSRHPGSNMAAPLGARITTDLDVLGCARVLKEGVLTYMDCLPGGDKGSDVSCWRECMSWC